MKYSKISLRYYLYHTCHDISVSVSIVIMIAMKNIGLQKDIDNKLSFIDEDNDNNNDNIDKINRKMGII